MMIRILRKILGLCNHSWKIIDEEQFIWKCGQKQNTYIMQCGNCGNLKITKLLLKF